MATTFTGTPAKVQVGGTLSSIRTGLPNLDDNAGWVYTGPTLTNGTAAGQVDRRYVVQLTIAASGNTVLNLSSLLDPFGGTIPFLRVKEIFFWLTNATAAASILIGGATNPFVNWITAGTAQLRIRNNMCFYLGACGDAVGYVVTPTTGDQLKLTNEDAGLAATVDGWLTGCSA
jgi:hypothetical protein